MESQKKRRKDTYHGFLGYSADEYKDKYAKIVKSA